MERGASSLSARWVVLAVAMVAAAGLLMWRGLSGNEDTSPAAEVTNEQTSGIGQDLARREADDPLAMGDVDAPVVLVEYADFRCPFCGVFARDTKPALMKYIDDGTLRVEFRDLPIFGEQSTAAAHAARAAGEQDRFWEFYESVYADAPARGHADLDRAALLDHARDAGVPDMDRFEKDMDSDEVAAAVQKDADEAYSLGASSTPTFVVGDTPVLGAQPTDVFVQLVEEAAARG